LRKNGINDHSSARRIFKVPYAMRVASALSAGLGRTDRICASSSRTTSSPANRPRSAIARAPIGLGPPLFVRVGLLPRNGADDGIDPILLCKPDGLSVGPQHAREVSTRHLAPGFGDNPQKPHGPRARRQ